MTATLTDRYVDAAMRTVPDAQRADLSAELRGSIDDQIDARRQQGEDRESAERAVLTELGDPEKLAADFTDRPLQLIGPRYYLTWWRLLKLLWTIVPVCAAFGVALGMTIAGEPAGGIIGTVAAVTVSVVVHVGFWTTLVFFLVERHAKGTDVGFQAAWSLDDLPLPEERRAGLGDLIASLVFLALWAGAVLWDHLVGLAYDGERWVSFFSPALWPWAIGGLFVLLLLEALHAIWVYAQGRWTKAAAVVNVLLNLAIAVPIVVLAATQNLLDPQFFPALIGGDSGETVRTIVNILFAFGAVAIGGWDAIDGIRRARRAAAVRQ